MNHKKFFARIIFLINISHLLFNFGFTMVELNIASVMDINIIFIMVFWYILTWSLSKKLIKSTSAERMGWLAVRFKYLSSEALLFSTHSILKPVPGSACCWLPIFTFVDPIRFFCGAGGIITPDLKYFSTSKSCNPKKSLNRRKDSNCLSLKSFSKFVRVTTLKMSEIIVWSLNKSRKWNFCAYLYAI